MRAEHRSGFETLVKLVVAASLLLAADSARPESAPRLVSDKLSYNAGDPVNVEVTFASAGATRSVEGLRVTIRYAGESAPVVNGVPLAPVSAPSARKFSTGYGRIWKIPFDARAGRYEVDLILPGEMTAPGERVLTAVAAFVVHRKLVQVSRLELAQSVYTPGDSVGCSVRISNLTDRPLAGLRVEFSERYWPWIAQSTGDESVKVETLRADLALRPFEGKTVRRLRCAVAPEAKRTELRQFAVVLWDQARGTIYDIAFSPLAIVRPPGDASPPRYPGQYVYSDLASIDPSRYRHFYPPEFNSAAIQFDRSHTMFDSRRQAVVDFSVSNPTEKPWRGVTVRAHLRAVGSAGFATLSVAENLDLEPRASPMKKQATFRFPDEAGGVFRVVVEVSDAAGVVVAASSLEVAANPLPKSVLIFCAHEDDETLHPGIIRAAVENQIPIHVVYFTSGDAGSCDRFFERSCGPAEALMFGALRMEEARASLSHLGVARGNVSFLGLPDGGSELIWFRHVEDSNPYLSVLLASDHAPYEGIVRPNLPYARKPVVEVAKEFINKFQPEVIYTGHPDERHVDHRTNNWFVVKALQELRREGAVSEKLQLLVDQVYGPGPQKRAPYRYEKHILHVSGEAMARAQEATWLYQSQGGNRALGHIRTFSQLPRLETHWQVLDWKDHEGWNEER